MADWYKTPAARAIVDFDPEGAGQWIPHHEPDGTGPEPVPFRPPPPDWEAEERERLAQVCDIEAGEDDE